MADQAQLIATLSVRMDKFEKQMKDAVAVAEKAVDGIEKEFAKANPQLGVSAIAKGSFLGNVAAKAAKELLSILKELPEQFERLAKSADIAQVSIVQAFQVAAALGDMDKASKLLETIGVQLERIRQGATDTPLQKLFEANQLTMAKDTQAVMDQLIQLLGQATTAQKELAIQTGAVSREMVELANKSDDAAKKIDAVAKVSPGFQSILFHLKDITIQAEIWGLTMIAAILEIGAKGDDMLARLAEKMERLTFQASQIPLFGPGVGLGLRAAEALGFDVGKGIAASGDSFRKDAETTRQAIDDITASLKRLEEQRKKLQFIGPPIPADLGKAGIKVPVGGAGAESDFAREEERIKKRIELIKAETEAIGQSVEQRTRARAQAEVSQKTFTESEKQQIDALIEKYAKLAQQQEDANRRFQAGAQIAATVGSAMSTAFADAVLEGKKLNDVMNALIKTLARAAINAAFTSLFSAQTGGIGNILGNLLKGKQGGGAVYGGRGYVVGERGPELFLPNTSGMIVPNKHLGGGVTVAPIYNIDASGADQAAIARLERALVATNASIETRVRKTVFDDRRRRL
jgi:hypothetical protein